MGRSTKLREDIREDTEKARKFAEEQYEKVRAVGGKSSQEQVSPEKHTAKAETKEKVKISDLLNNHGVTAEDFQSLYESNPEIIGEIGGGATCEKLAKSADKVITMHRRGRPLTGKCLPGVRKIYDRADSDSLSCADARNAIIYSRKPYQKTNGGGNGYIALEASGDYLMVKIENTAYGKPKRCPEDKIMNDTVRVVQPGITITVDSIEDRHTRLIKGNNDGGKYGHIAVKRNDGNWGCDFNQSSIDFSRYGKYARICFPKDAEISSEYAQMLIDKAQERQQQAQLKQQQIVAAKSQTR